MKAYQMKIAIKDSHPPIWRRFIVPAGLSFSQLSIVLNEVMGWCGYHLSAFEFYHLGLRIEEEPEDIPWGDYDVESASETMIEPYMDSEEWFTYVYDFGDDWNHRVTVEKMLPDYEHNYPMVLKFKGDTPYEDCGGIYRYYDLLDILKAPSHPEYEDMKEWTDNHFTGEYRLDEVNERLKGLRLSSKKSGPMTQNEIYEEITEKGLPFKQIQGIEKIPVMYGEKDIWDEGDFGFGLEDIEGIQDEILKFADNMKEIQIQSLLKAPEDMRLSDILMDYKKNDLISIAGMHSLSGYSKYRKKELADFVAREILSESVVRRYFIYLEDEEIEVLEKGEKKAGGCVQDWPCDYGYLLDGGYCGGLFGDSCLIPKEVWDAYQKNCDAEWKAEREEKREIIDYLNAMAQLNGCCKLSDVLRVYEKNTKVQKNSLDAWRIFMETPEAKRWFRLNEKDEVILIGFEDEQVLRNLKKLQKKKEVYCPTPQEVKALSRKGYLPFDRHMKKLQAFLINSLGEFSEDAKLACGEIQSIIRIGGDMQEIMDYVQDFLDMGNKDLQRFVPLLQNVWNHTRMISNCGHTPEEMLSDEERNTARAVKRAIASRQTQPGNWDINDILETADGKIIDFPAPKQKKIYRNDPCPCGSGKKYKNCCGKRK